KVLVGGGDSVNEVTVAERLTSAGKAERIDTRAGHRAVAVIGVVVIADESEVGVLGRAAVGQAPEVQADVEVSAICAARVKDSVQVGRIVLPAQRLGLVVGIALRVAEMVPGTYEVVAAGI